MIMKERVFSLGTYRSVTPEETFSRISGLFPAFGITRIANLTGLDRTDIPVTAAIRPNSKSLAVSQGKGHTLAAAKVSAAMESIESFHAETIMLPSVYCSYDDLEFKGKIADLPGLSQKSDSYFDAYKKINWLQSKDLLNKSTTFLPYDSVSGDLCIEEIPDSIFIPDSNGLASGNTLLEAQIHGLCEVIERDSLSIFWLSNLQNRHKMRVNINTINDPNLLFLIEKITSANIKISVWDVTHDTRIPTYLCKVSETDMVLNTVRPAFGSGTHLNKSIALSRAITEAIQSRVSCIAGARDDQYKQIYNSALSTEFHEEFNVDDILLDETLIDFNARENLDSDSFEEDRNRILEILDSIGMKQVLCVDLTKAEFGIPVCKIVIPHMQFMSNVGRAATARTKNYMESR
jgi:YcaO-like protein with predicted kinase domain